MTEKSQDDWRQYSVGKPSTKEYWVNFSCQELTSVLHVTHLFTALEVLRAGCIRPQLIYDKSRLNTKRVLVVWLSPNDWYGAGGYRYGNVAFEFDWKSLIHKKKRYWVGAMDYNPTACRILITDKNRDSSLKRYLPKQGDGPWFVDSKSNHHYWNGEYCLEFMLEDEIPLSNISKLSFVSHHQKRCSISPSDCPDSGHSGNRASARLLAGACDRRLLTMRPNVWVDEKKNPKECLIDAWDSLRERICNGIKLWDAAVLEGSKKGRAIARAGMGALCDLNADDRKQLMGLFGSQEAAIETCASVIESDLKLSSGTLARSDENE